MKTPMTSRERLLAAIRHQPVDHLPLMLRFWSMGTPEQNIPFPWEEQVTRVEQTLALGLDDTLLLEPPFGYTENYRPEQVPGVSSRVWTEPASGESQSHLVKRYETPDGPLQTVLNFTEDWPHGEEVRLFDDYNVPRLVEPLIKTATDLRPLRCLLGTPSPAQMQAWRTQAQALRAEADRLQVVLDGGWSALGDATVWLIGMQRLLYGQMDEPAMIEQVLDTLFEWEIRRMDWTLSEGVDVWVHMAWYEGSDFWTPKNFRKLIKPRLADLVSRAHAYRVPFRYIITKGWKPLRGDLVEIGVDCITGVDPVQDHVDLAEVKREIGSKICLMGGLNSVVMLTQYSEAQIRQSVDVAAQTLSPGGGSILFPVDAVFNDQPWKNVEVVLDEWNKVRDSISS